MKKSNPSPAAVYPPHVRWMIRKDMPRVLEIAAACSSDPWGEEAFLAYLRKRNQIAWICELGCDLAGYLLYSIYERHYHVDALAVDPALRRRGAGSAMLRRIVDKVSTNRRDFAGIFVPAPHLEVNQFVRSCGFKVRGVLRGSKNGSGDVLYFKALAKSLPESHKGVNRPPAAGSAD